MKQVKPEVSKWVRQNKGIIGHSLVGKYGMIITDNHHALRDTKGNRKNFPKLIHSIINIYVIEHTHHIDRHGSCPKMTDLEAGMWEKFLEDNPDIARFVNNPAKELPYDRKKILMDKMTEHDRLNGRLWEGK